MSKVFISHSTQDREFVEQQLIPLLTRHGIEVWYAPEDIHSASVWERTILSGLKECDWFSLVMSRKSAESEWVKDELHWAIASRSGCIVPIMLEECNPFEFHIRLARIQHVDFTNGSSESACKKLLQNWNVEYHQDDLPTKAASVNELKSDSSTASPSHHPKASTKESQGDSLQNKTSQRPPSKKPTRSDGTKSQRLLKNGGTKREEDKRDNSTTPKIPVKKTTSRPDSVSKPNRKPALRSLQYSGRRPSPASIIGGSLGIVLINAMTIIITSLFVIQTGR